MAGVKADLETARMMLGTKFAAKLKDKKVLFETNGHFCNGASLSKYEIESRLWALFMNIPQQEVWILDRIIENPEKPLPRFIQLHNSLFTCDQCDMPLRFETNGTVIRACGTKCPFPHSLRGYELKLNVPSGSMVFGNDFRPYFRLTGRYGGQTRQRRFKMAKKCESLGFVHGYVADSSPSMWRVTPEEFVIGISGTFHKVPPVKDGIVVGNIETDLWWFSLADYDEFVRRAGRKPGMMEDEVDCRPGLYKVNYIYEISNYEAYCGRIFARITREGEPEEQPDYKSEWDNLNLTLGQVIHRTSNNLVVADGRSRVSGALFQIFCTDYRQEFVHPNGWIGFDPDITANEPILGFDRIETPQRWWLTDRSFLTVAAGISNFAPAFQLNNTFQRGALEVCRCICERGVDDDNAERKAKTLDLAHRISESLSKQYGLKKK